jgi:hypothetical protein
VINRSTLIAYVDFLFALFVLFAMAALAVLKDNHDISQGNVVQKAEFVAILEWPESSQSDVDLWVRNPYGTVVNFRDKDAGLISLDRDDLGVGNDSITGPDGQPIAATTRREEASIRAIMPGRHVVNVMLYALRDNPPIRAKVQIIKLNPYRVIVEREIDLSTKGEERTVATFDVAADGSVANVDTTDEVSLAKVIP